MRHALTLTLLAFFASCGAADQQLAQHGGDGTRSSSGNPGKRHLIVLGTNDVHGHIERLAQLSGYVGCIEAQNPSAEVMLLDGGDLFQGTLESNLNEGRSVIEIFNALRLTAAAVGNHEFDFGPAGEAATPQSDEDDARGALKERMSEATFPFLSANLKEEATGVLPDWPNLRASLIVQRAGFRVGLLGLSTEETLTATLAANVRGLSIEPPAVALVREASKLREKNVDLIIAIAHIGGRCESFDNPNDLSSCRPDDEMFRLLRQTPPGTIDAFIGGHSHKRVAHVINGVAASEAAAHAKYFGRFDIVERNGTTAITVEQPEPICTPDEDCAYRGCNVREHADKEIDKIVTRYVDAARKKRNAHLGVRSESRFDHIQVRQSPIGNLVADLTLEAYSGADFSIMNGGGIRSSLPEGDLTYGDIFELYPFDNRFAVVEMSGSQLREMLVSELSRGARFPLMVSGIRVSASCKEGQPRLTMKLSNGKPIRPKKTYRIVTNDFLATGGDGLFAGARVTLDDGPLMRDAMVEALKKNHPILRAGDPKLTTKRYPTKDALKDCQPRKAQ